MQLRHKLDNKQNSATNAQIVLKKKKPSMYSILFEMLQMSRYQNFVIPFLNFIFYLFYFYYFIFYLFIMYLFIMCLILSEIICDI